MFPEIQFGCGFQVTACFGSESSFKDHSSGFKNNACFI